MPFAFHLSIISLKCDETLFRCTIRALMKERLTFTLVYGISTRFFAQENEDGY
jgi:hypothetical protein